MGECISAPSCSSFGYLRAHVLWLYAHMDNEAGKGDEEKENQEDEEEDGAVNVINQGMLLSALFVCKVQGRLSLAQQEQFVGL